VVESILSLSNSQACRPKLPKDTHYLRHGIKNYSARVLFAFRKTSAAALLLSIFHAACRPAKLLGVTYTPSSRKLSSAIANLGRYKLLNRLVESVPNRAALLSIKIIFCVGEASACATLAIQSGFREGSDLDRSADPRPDRSSAP